ncbi:MAG: TlpA family protein disulfide reductase [Candidatus Thiodiazotropha sp.]|nr:TlpA family protein disulfide reductase [Candidatus Thiodiazotropha sp.]MCM8882309.1 TlpA family protein disulfide reductase [Candidatus Thiodiazotropha sp.]MCM8919637.1 TlpA family protein disulfide reductase [Candidatus Thiodiazotropha sp.]
MSLIKASYGMFVVHPDPLKWIWLLLGVWLLPVYADLPPLTHGLTLVPQPHTAPALRLPTMDDETIDIEALKGKVVVVNFWATWCPPCRREMPSLERLYQTSKEKGLVVLAVNIGEDIDTIFPFLGTVDPSPSFPILLDNDSHSLSEWKVRGLPTTFVVGPDGNLVYQAVGGREFNHPALLQQLLDLLKE